jgi:hypothetical protein
VRTIAEGVLLVHRNRYDSAGRARKHVCTDESYRARA